ncbi:MAG: SPASM domain-containing protein [Proteobacteria bacterium]|nr:SPASM domain-containing protein [Pseudomonadota bacterium]
MEQQTLRVNALRVAAEKLGFFRFGRLGDKVVLTNDAGDWHLLSAHDFAAFVEGRMEPEHPEYAALVQKCFVRDGADLDGLAERIGRKKRFLGVGPHLVVVITTLRCNQSCCYCHASRADMSCVETDMTIETAEKVVNHALQSNSSYVNFEFQGGEPTVNIDVVRHIVDYAREKNKEIRGRRATEADSKHRFPVLESRPTEPVGPGVNGGIGKTIDFSLVTNMTAMTTEIADWLIANDIYVCTSLDGPQEVHNWNRGWKKDSNAYEAVVHWIKYFRDRYISMGRDPELWHVDALLTTTRKTLEHFKEVVDLYVSLGIRNLHLRPLNPFGFAEKSWRRVGYTMEEFLDFYARALDYIIELNKQGVQIIEGNATVFLTKMLTPDDPNYVDIRSPCGAGTGQVAYGYDGKIYPCDEARMLAAMGDEMFNLGHLDSSTMVDTLQHPTIKTLMLASLQDGLPGCDTCWNLPFCGVCPVYNYRVGGDVFGQRPQSAQCKQYLAIAHLLMEHLANDEDGQVAQIFSRWTVRRTRDEDS